MNPKRLAVFFFVFAAIAVVICAVQRANEQQRAVTVAQQQRAMQAQKAVQDAAMAQAKSAQEAAAQKAKADQDAAAARAKAIQDAEIERAKAIQQVAAEHAQYLARYLNAGLPQKQKSETVAIVVASENGKLNRTVTDALARHFKTGNFGINSAFFNPEFVSDGLFDDVFSGSGEVLNKLELAKSLDALLLARQEVQYAPNPSLGNVQIHFHPLIEVAVGDVTERLAVSFGHSRRTLFNEFDVQFCVEFGVKTPLFKFLIGIERIAMIGFSIEMRENLLKDFLIYAPVEPLQT